MTKEDYMCLPKERLAELLVERELNSYKWPTFWPTYIERKPMCYEPGGFCTNPFHDCVNCPKKYFYNTTNTTGTFSSQNTSTTDESDNILTA